MTSTDMESAQKVSRTPVPQQLAGFAYQGLPAKFDLPSGSRFTSFSQELLRADREQAVRVVAISMGLVKVIGLVIALVVVFVLFRDRRALQEALRARTQVAPAPEVVAT